MGPDDERVRYSLGDVIYYDGKDREWYRCCEGCETKIEVEANESEPATWANRARKDALTVELQIETPFKVLHQLRKLFRREDYFLWQKRRLRRLLGRSIKTRVK